VDRGGAIERFPVHLEEVVAAVLRREIEGGQSGQAAADLAVPGMLGMVAEAGSELEERDAHRRGIQDEGRGAVPDQRVGPRAFRIEETGGRLGGNDGDAPVAAAF